MKLKSHSGAKKRIKLSGKGKLILRKSCKNHLLINKSKRQKAQYNPGKPIDASDERKFRRLLPYSY